MTTKTKILIGLALSLTLVFGIYFAYNQTVKADEIDDTEVTETTDTPDIEIVVPPITDNNAEQSAADGTQTNEPSVTTDENGNQTVTPNYEKPEYSEDALTNPEVKPSDTVKEETKKPSTSNSSSSSSSSSSSNSNSSSNNNSNSNNKPNNEGKVNIPGFGWVDYPEGGSGGQGESSNGTSGDMDTQVGSMG